jgi:hypothetical protein
MMEGQLFTRPYLAILIGRRTGRQVTMRHRRLMQQDLTSTRTSLTSDIRQHPAQVLTYYGKQPLKRLQRPRRRTPDHDQAFKPDETS